MKKLGKKGDLLTLVSSDDICKYATLVFIDNNDPCKGDNDGNKRTQQLIGGQGQHVQLFMYHMEINFWRIKYKGMAHNIVEFEFAHCDKHISKGDYPVIQWIAYKQAHWKWHNVEDNEALT